MKELLLFMTDFYGYNSNIILELEKQNNNVTWFLDKVKLTTKDRLIGKFNKKYLEKIFNNYFEQCINSVKEKHFDEILIIFGANFMNSYHINRLKEVFPGVKIVYYAWDSVKNFPNIKELIENSDIAYTFDSNDAKQFKIELLPLFYIKRDTIKDTNVYRYDVSTVMSFFVEKVDNFKKVIHVLPKELNKKFYLKVRDQFYLNKLKLLDYMILLNLFSDNYKKIKEVISYFELDSLNREEVYDIFNDSKAIIDCPLPNQNGLTMRTFEVLSMNKKLITTNKNVKDYDFYCEDNIYVVEDDEKIPLEFFETDFNNKYALDEKYSITKFVEKLTEI